MIHLTLNTGHVRHSPRDEVASDVIAAMIPLTQPGSYDLGTFGLALQGWRLEVPACPAGYYATLYGGSMPVLSLAVARTTEDADIVWPALERSYRQVTDLPGSRGADFEAPYRPNRLPWLAVALLFPLACPAWAGDFERCLAWAWLEDEDDE